MAYHDVVTFLFLRTIVKLPLASYWLSLVDPCVKPLRGSPWFAPLGGATTCASANFDSAQDDTQPFYTSIALLFYRRAINDRPYEDKTTIVTILGGFEYTYDDLSRIIEEKALANSTKMCYTYDIPDVFYDGLYAATQ